MAKTKTNTKTEASKTPSSKADFVEETDVDTAPSSETDHIKVAEVQKEASDTLAAIQVALSLNTSSFSDQESVALKKASVARYRDCPCGRDGACLRDPVSRLAECCHDVAGTCGKYRYARCAHRRNEKRSSGDKSSCGSDGGARPTPRTWQTKRYGRPGHRRNGWSGHCRQCELRRQAQHQARGDRRTRTTTHQRKIKHRRGTAGLVLDTHKRNTAPMLASPRCGARTRSAMPCGSPAVAGKKGAACMAERRAPARRRAIKMRSSMGAIRARRSSDGRRCALVRRPETCSKTLRRPLFSLGSNERLGTPERGSF